ncbi:MAG: ATP-binding protein, partial [Treponema sp.]|nr:ATP-binding protein [Treponema sp.]
QILRQIREQVRLQKDLEEAVIVAENANIAKSAFLARMSHEIRTPLNAVIGLSEIELQGSLSEKSKNNISQIYQSGSTLLGIINDILDISKIEAGGFELVAAEYQTASFINDTINLNRVRIGSKKINLILEINGNFPAKLVGDELRVKQILNNVLSNAIKYTNEGNVTLSVTWEKAHKNAKAVLLRFIIRDTGLGIRKSDMERIFFDYTQLDTKANRMIEGTGLGLAITKKLLEMMGGNITVKSEYGKGSVFTIELIQNIFNVESIGDETAENLRKFLYVSDNKGMNIERKWMPNGKILVVDDMPVNLQVAEGLLEPYGLQIDTASSGHEAVDLIISGKKYDLIFMDHMMPGMDGVETVECIRKWEKEQKKNERVPIIALTANAVVGNVEMFMANGFNGFVSKPINITHLDDVLNQWIQGIEKKAAINDEQKIDIHTFEIPGVDISSGVTATGGTIKGYRKVLTILCKDARSHLPLLKNEMNNDSISGEFTTQIHAFKSALATVGAARLSQMAALLENAGKSADVKFKNDNLPAFIEQLDDLINNIENYFNNDNSKSNSENNNEKIESHMPLFQTLISLLKSGAPASDINKLIEELSQKPFNSRIIEALDKVSHEVLMAEYDNALQIVNNLLL